MKRDNPNYYWQPYHQDALLLYITCASAVTSGITQQRIFNDVFYTPLTHMASQALYSTGVPLSDSYKDYINDILIHLYTKILPIIKIDRAETFIHYAYKSCRNYIINNVLVKGNKNKIDYTDNDIDVIGTYSADELVSKYDIRVQIIERLDYMIKQQKIMNKTNTIFLLLLRQYLIDNEFNPIGFKEYVMRTMNIKSTTFIGICSRLRITTKLFKEENVIK